MHTMIFKLCVLFCIVSLTIAAQNVRKYNVEQESFKLYKQDFKSVLKRFRRTTDYLKILQDKLAELRITTREMSLQVLHYFHGKMEKQVMDVLPVQPSNWKLEDDDKNYFRTGDKAEPAPPHISEKDWQKITELDKYNFFYSQLSVPERNSLKELGFTYAGQIIHSIIANLKPVTNSEEDKQRVTNIFDSSTVKTANTEHPESHKWRYVFNDGSTIHQVKPLETTVNTTPAEDHRFRASTSPAKVELAAVAKHARY